MTIRSFKVWPLVPVILFVCLIGGTSASSEGARSLYSYSDEKGTRVITDDYTKIPAAYRTGVTAVTQETDGSDTNDLTRVVQRVGSAREFVVEVPGMSFEQSRVITYAGAIALLCLLAVNFSRSEAIRLLALWSLVLTMIGAPVLVYVADDGPAAIMKNKAKHIQQKHQDRLSHAP